MSKLTITCPILGYHQVTPDAHPVDLGEYAISESQFLEQMAFLHNRGYTCLSVEALLALAKAGTTQNRKTFVLTFDDGYEDFYQVVYPILQKFGFTATVFLVADLISMPDELRQKRKNRYLSWEQIRGLQKKGISFGSHTSSHVNLPTLEPEAALQELTDSRQKLEAGLGQPVRWMAYPFSATNCDIEGLAEKAGYEAAFSGSRGTNSSFNIRRHFCMRDDTLTAFKFKVSVIYNTIARFRDETALGQTLRRLKKIILLQGRQE